MNYSQYLLLFCCLIFSVHSFAQFNEKDQSLLHEELSLRINKLRLSKGLEGLTENEILQKAAKNHSLYLVEKKKLSHWQVEATFASPQKRVKYFGGEDFEIIGENVLVSSKQRFPLKNDEISDLAKEMYESWFNSPGHYANMIDAEYTEGNLAFGWDEENSVIYATHVFGKKGIRVGNQLSSNAFDIKEQELGCGEKELNYFANIIANMGDDISIEENDIIFNYHNKYFFDKIFINEKDGFAVDIMTTDQFTCSGPNQLDMSAIYDGVLLKPIYRKEILANNKASNPSRISSKIAEIPIHLRGKDLTMSLVIIKDGHICRYLMPLSVPRLNYFIINCELNLENPKGVKLKEKGIVHSQVLEYEFKTNITTPINLPEIKSEKNKVHSVDIFSFSSIEGATKINEKLHTERAQSIRSHVAASLNINPRNVNISAKENWTKMNFQFKYHNRYDLLDLSKEEIKLLAKSDMSLPWDMMLKEQRKSIAVIHYEGNVSINSSQSILASINLREAISRNDIRLANKALYELYYANGINEELLFEETIFQALKNNKSLVKNASAVMTKVFDYDIFKSAEILDSWMLQFDDFDDDTRKNILYLASLISYDLMDSWDVEVKRLSKVILPQRLHDYAGKLEISVELQANLHMVYLLYGGQTNDYSLSRHSFEYISDYYAPKVKNHKDLMSLTRFFNYWSRYDKTIKKLYPKFYDDELEEDAVFLLMKTITLYPEGKEYEDYEEVYEKAFSLNADKWCQWIGDNIQLLREQGVKRMYCENCGE